MRTAQIVAAPLMIALSPLAVAQTSSGHMELDDMSAGGPRLAIARVEISKTNAACPRQTGTVRIDAHGAVRDTVVALPGGHWLIETNAADADDLSFRRRVTTDSCRIDIDVSEQQKRNGEWVPLSKQPPERPEAVPGDHTRKINDRAAAPPAESAFDRYNQARATAGSLRQGVLGIVRNSLWKGELQDCFEAAGTYLIDQSGVTLLFPTDLGGELNRFFIERVDVDADHSTLFLSRGSCRVGFTVSASILQEGSWVPLPIAPPRPVKSERGAERN